MAETPPSRLERLAGTLANFLNPEERTGGRVGAQRAATPWPDAGMRAILQAMREPALLADRALTLRYCNPASDATFGTLSPGDPIALRFRTPDLLSAAEAVLADGLPRRVELIERSPRARFFQIEIVGVQRDDETLPGLLLIMMHDRTAERRIERMRTDFVANASHELRTPLASLIGFIETLQGAARNDAKARDRFLGIMRDQAGRMSRLIDDLLSLSRIETKAALAPGETADLADIFTHVRDALEAPALVAGLKLEIMLPDAAGTRVNGNHDELAQVFSNLVENAVKYAGGGGRVILGMRIVDGGHAVEAYVQDFGQGIPSEHVPRLTERFYRVEDGGAGRSDGTGLGLSIVRNILQRHNTRLQVDSTPGIGSTFALRLQPARVRLQQTQNNL